MAVAAAFFKQPFEPSKFINIVSASFAFPLYNPKKFQACLVSEIFQFLDKKFQTTRFFCIISRYLSFIMDIISVLLLYTRFFSIVG